MGHTGVYVYTFQMLRYSCIITTLRNELLRMCEQTHQYLHNVLFIKLQSDGAY